MGVYPKATQSVTEDFKHQLYITDTLDGWIRLFWSHNNMYILTYLTAQLFPSTHCTTWDKHTCYSLQLWECKRPWSQFVANSKMNTKYSGHTIYKSKNRGQNVLLYIYILFFLALFFSFFFLWLCSFLIFG